MVFESWSFESFPISAMFVQLVSEADLPELGTEGQIIVRFRVFGTTLGGQEIESGDFDYPIFMCDGCLVRYPIDTNVAPPGDPYLCGVTAMASGSGCAGRSARRRCRRRS